MRLLMKPRRARQSEPGTSTEMAAPPGLPRAYLRPCLLLLLTQGASHGYELLEAVRNLGLHAAEAGGLYRSLRAMDDEGVVRSWWEPSETGPARRTYAITAAGRRALREHVVEIEGVARLLDGIVAQARAVTALSSR